MTDQQLDDLVARIGDEMLGRLGLSHFPTAPAEAACACDAEMPQSASAPAGWSSSALERNCRDAGLTAADISARLLEASTLKLGAVSVLPSHVTAAGRARGDSEVRVIAAIGWPHGATSTGAKAYETELALGQGADEIESVVSIGSLLAGEDDQIFGELKFLAEMTHRAGKSMTVVIETAQLDDQRLIAGCALARLAGADAVCAAAGLTNHGVADPATVELFRKVVGDDLRLKATGGVISAAAAAALAAAGADRLTIDDLAAVRGL